MVGAVVMGGIFSVVFLAEVVTTGVVVGSLCGFLFDLLCDTMVTATASAARTAIAVIYVTLGEGCFFEGCIIRYVLSLSFCYYVLYFLHSLKVLCKAIDLFS